MGSWPDYWLSGVISFFLFDRWPWMASDYLVEEGAKGDGIGRWMGGRLAEEVIKEQVM